MAPASETSDKKGIIVLGAGVVGLTTALNIQKQGNYMVTVISEIIPSDPKSIKYTSRWAGAHHVYNSLDAGIHDLEEKTFDIMWDLSKSGSDAEECFLRVPQTQYYRDAQDVDIFKKLPNFRRLPESELIPGSVLGISFTTVTIDVPIYLNYLLTQFLANGGRILRGSVQHINQLIEGGTSLFSGGTFNDPPPDAIVVAVGLGARFLGGVEDKAMYPVRGQTVLIRAPWVRFGRSELEGSTSLTYIIPRRSGDAIVGGTRVADDWYPKPRPEITQDILERAFALCPELASPDIRVGRKPTIDDISSHVVSEGCGFRPARKGGIRLEVEWTEGIGGRGRVPVIHNYGHSGYGYQTSWGCAIKVLELLEQALTTV